MKEIQQHVDQDKLCLLVSEKLDTLRRFRPKAAIISSSVPGRTFSKAVFLQGWREGVGEQFLLPPSVSTKPPDASSPTRVQNLAHKTPLTALPQWAHQRHHLPNDKTPQGAFPGTSIFQAEKAAQLLLPSHN